MEDVKKILEESRSCIVELCTVMNVPLPSGTIRRIERVLSQQQEQSMPEELFNGHAVYQETVRHRRDSGLLVRTLPENVSDTLDAVVRLIKSRSAEVEQQLLLPTASDLEAVLDECEAFRDLSDVAHGWYEALECMSRLKKEETK